MTGTKSPQSIETRIISCLTCWGPGTVVLPSHFVDIGSREAVGVALHRRVKDGQIRRLSRGIYDIDHNSGQGKNSSIVIDADQARARSIAK